MLNKYPSFCFSLNSFVDETTAKIGTKECVEHDLLLPYPVLTEKPGDFVASFKFTVMVNKASTSVLTGLPIDESLYKTDKKIEDK